MIALGIDPGLTGAVALVDATGRCRVEQLPTVALSGAGMVKRRIDGHKLGQQVRSWCPVGDRVVVAIEALRTVGWRGNAAQTQDSLMRTVGAIEGVLDMLRLPFRSVEPQVWKGFYGIGASKREALHKALVLYPDAPVRLMADHNKAEALLIAHWALRTFE